MIDGCGIENDVVMDMGMISMSGDDKLILAFGKAHGQLIADLLCLLWGDLTWIEGLPDLIEHNVALLLFTASNVCFIFFFAKQHLSSGGFWFAGIGFDELSAIRFIRIDGVGKAFMYRVSHGLTFDDVHGD